VTRAGKHSRKPHGDYRFLQPVCKTRTGAGDISEGAVVQCRFPVPRRCELFDTPFFVWKNYKESWFVSDMSGYSCARALFDLERVVWTKLQTVWQPPQCVDSNARAARCR